MGRRLLVILMILFQITFLAVMIFRTNQLIWLSGILNFLSIATALHLLRRPDKTDFKLSLVFIILLLPLFGGVFYWVFHFQTGNVGFRKRMDRQMAKQRAEYKKVESIPTHAAEVLPQDMRLVRYLQNTAAFPVYSNTQTHYFGTGKEMLEMMLEDLKNANRYIFLEYFIISEGIMWDSILEILSQKAKSGVDVRVIYDDFGSLIGLPEDYFRKLRAMGIQCEVFNPFHPFLTTMQNNRDHRKIAVVDGKIAYTGGINLADEYINERIRFGHWKDNSIRVCGEAAASFTLMFLQMWGLLTKKKEDMNRFRPDPHFTAVSDGWIQPYTDTPMDKEDVGEQVYLHAIQRTQRYLYITTPYLMVGDELMSAIKYAAKSGVDVRIITPGKPDKPMVHFTTRSYYRELISAGIKVYEFSKGFMHAKTFISDGELAIVGTVNMDFRSLYLHYECGACLYCSSAIERIEEDFQECLSQCREMTEADCRASFPVRILQDICRIFAPLM